MLKTAVCACIMAVAVYGLAGLLEGILPGIAGKLAVLFLPAAAGVIIFFAAAALLRLEEVEYIRGFIRKFLKRG